MILLDSISLVGLFALIAIIGFLLVLYFKRINRQSDQLFEERVTNLEQAINMHKSCRADRYKLLNTYDFSRYNLGEVLVHQC